MKRVLTTFLTVLCTTNLTACLPTMAKPMTVNPLVNCDFNVIGTGAAVAQPGQSPSVAAIPPNSFNYIEANIGNKIIAQAAALSTNGSGTTRLDVRFANCTDFPLQVEARTQFMGGSGMPIENVSGWKRIFLQPRSFAQYQESSTSDMPVANYLVDVREGY